MFLNERDPKWLIENGYLEKISNFKNSDDGETVLASRLGYRITESFVQTFFGRMFNEPTSVFTEEMLRPELQSEADYVEGIANICETQQRVAARYFEDGSIDLAIPPLKALLHFMAHGEFEGKSINDPEVRALFDRETVLESDWYLARLDAKLAVRRRTLTSQIVSLEAFLEKEVYASEAERLNIQERLDQARERIKIADETPEVYLKKLRGTLGADVVFG